MRLQTLYEWGVELHDNDPSLGDDFDTDHFDKFADAADMAKESEHYRLVLIRDVGSDDEGLVDRAWAYVENGQLPTVFKDAADAEVASVPKRFFDEVTRYRRKEFLDKVAG